MVTELLTLSFKTLSNTVDQFSTIILIDPKTVGCFEGRALLDPNPLRRRK
jgi:hypothetical protein